ncbi:MAG: Rieske (2Fe-2S) protein [Bacteroidota bacterium]
MERRDFLKQCGALCLSSVGMAATLQSCKTLYVPNETVNNRILVKKADFQQGNFVLIRNNRLQAPLYLRKETDDKYTAVLMLCTHKGCELNTAGDRLVCPCHGSEFSHTGQVLSPPADKDLRPYAVTSDTNTIYIQL